MQRGHHSPRFFLTRQRLNTRPAKDSCARASWGGAGGGPLLRALYTIWYNYVRQHKTHRLSPAMAAGITDKLWSMTDLAEMIDATLPEPGKRGPYKARVEV